MRGFEPARPARQAGINDREILAGFLGQREEHNLESSAYLRRGHRGVIDVIVKTVRGVEAERPHPAVAAEPEEGGIELMHDLEAIGPVAEIEADRKSVV